MVTIFDSESLKQGNPGEKLVFDYQGEVNEEIIPYILEKVEARLKEQDFDISKTRRLGKICLEALQNIHEYYGDISNDAVHFGAYLYIYSIGEGFLVLIANYVKNDHKLRLFDELKELNKIEPEKRKAIYLEKLKNDEWSSRGGAGLGLIEMLWKSENRFRYEFEDIDPNYAMFILRLKIGRESRKDILEIEATGQSPYLRFDPLEGELQIRGRSIPENASVFYTPLFEAIDEYQNYPQALIRVSICLDYINTSSSKCLLELFKKLEQVVSTDCQVNINWCYEKGDDDMLEAGEDYELIIDLPFEFIELDEV